MDCTAIRQTFEYVQQLSAVREWTVTSCGQRSCRVKAACRLLAQRVRKVSCPGLRRKMPFHGIDGGFCEQQLAYLVRRRLSLQRTEQLLSRQEDCKHLRGVRTR